MSDMQRAEMRYLMPRICLMDKGEREGRGSEGKGGGEGEERRRGRGNGVGEGKGKGEGKGIREGITTGRGEGT